MNGNEINEVGSHLKTWNNFSRRDFHGQLHGPWNPVLIVELVVVHDHPATLSSGCSTDTSTVRGTLYGPWNLAVELTVPPEWFPSFRLISNPYGTFLALVYHFIINLGDVITLLHNNLKASLTQYS